MRSAGFAYLGLAKLLLSTDQALSKPMLSFPEPQQVKKTPLNGKKKAWNIHISRERHHSVHREKCRYTEANLVLAQLTHSPQGLPAVAAVSKQNRLHSSQKCGTTASGLGLLLPQNGKELVLSAMGRKQAGDPDPSSCDGNSVGWVGADIPSLRTSSPWAFPAPDPLLPRLAFQEQSRRSEACKHGISHCSSKMSSVLSPIPDARGLAKDAVYVIHVVLNTYFIHSQSRSC